MDQVIRFAQPGKDAFYNKMTSIAVLVDFKPAYYKVWKKMLLQKLIDVQVSGKLLKWIRHFLTQ